MAGLAPYEELALGAEDRLTANERRLTFFSTLIFGFLLTSDALVQLL